MSSEVGTVVTYLQGLMSHLGVTSDAALARKLGVGKSTIATWRRRGSMPAKVHRDIEQRLGLTPQTLHEHGADEVRHYLLKSAFYYVILKAGIGRLRASNSETVADFAQQLASAEEGLMKLIVRLAASEKYEGVAGAASLLIDLRSDRIPHAELMKEAMAALKEVKGDG